MPELTDFETQWLDKLWKALEERAGADAAEDVMRRAGDPPGARTASPETACWTGRVIALVGGLLGEEGIRDVMSGCSCSYPPDWLAAAREAYLADGDIRDAHRVLSEQTRHLLEGPLGLPRELADELLDKGWGTAGVLGDEGITVTKIPKSGYLRDYLRETDPVERRRIYCHCPRVRDAVGTDSAVDPAYCFCGGGFYGGIWEGILGRPVRVEPLSTVMAGGDLCRFLIHTGDPGRTGGA